MSGRQALTIVGQVVGAAFGPIGAAIGGVIGGEIGGAIDGPPEGPRLDDTSAPALEFGAKVPRLYGTVWCTLSPRWWSGLRESSEVVGGKGADSGVEQYSHHADLLGVLGEVDLTRWPNPTWTRVRVDGKVVASRLAASTTETLAISAETEHWSDLELFTGAAAQAPWSVMEAVEGATNANAYRGVVSVGFTNFWMQNGRRPSLVEIEIATASTSGAVDATTRLQTSYATESTTQDISAFAALNGTGTSTGIGSAGAGGWSTNGADTEDAYHEWTSTAIGNPDGEPISIEWCCTVTNTAGVNFNELVTWEVGSAPVRQYRVAVWETSGASMVHLSMSTPVTSIVIAYNVAPLDTEFHCMMRIDPGVGGVALFVNGVQVATGSTSANTGATGTLRIGCTGWAGAGSDPRDMVIGNVRLVYGYLDSGLTSCSLPPPDGIYDTITPGTVDLQDVLESEMLRCTPLTAAHIDMSAAAGKEVHGYKATGPAAAACAPLLDWYYLDLFCADKSTVVERGGASEQTIAYGYSGSAIDGASDPFAGLVAGNDVELQRATAVQYINPLADSEVDTQMGARLGTGSEIKQINFPIYALPTEAKGRADTITHDTRIASYRATVRLGALHAAKVQPASVLTLTDNKGNTYRVRVLRLVWNRGVYECEVCLDDPNILTDVGVTVEADTSVIEVTAPGVAEFLALDLPKLQPADEDPGYIGVVKTSTSVAARWYDSADDVTYAARADYATDAVFGTVTAASGAFAQGVLFDEGSSLTVDVGDGTLSSATRAALLADRARNAFAVGVNGRMVLGQFRSSTLVSPGVFTLAGFVNMGAKGTEQYCASITTGDDFWLVGTSGAARIPRALAQLGVGMYAKAVAFGRNLSGVTGEAFTPQGVSLKPLSPVRLRATRDVATGDASITWARRTRDDTRFGGDLGDACPLGEAAEQYRVRLYTSAAFTTLLRDLGVVATNAAPYTAAQLAADSKALSDPIYADIRQISAVVGEGYELQDTA